jgi:hypothetical protein
VSRSSPDPVVVHHFTEARRLMSELQSMVERKEDIEPTILTARRILELLEQVDHLLAQEELDRLMQERRPDAVRLGKLLERFMRRAA